MESINIAPWAPEPSRPPIATSIAQMNEQRGSFRDLTEQELEEDIARGAEDAMSEDQEDEEENSLAKKREELFKAKEQILKGLWTAQVNAATARDFISLLLSENRPGAAGSLGQQTRDHVPLGSLGHMLLKQPPVNMNQRREVEEVKALAERERMVATGIKLQSLNSSADTLLAAAKRLEHEMKKEAQHWEDLVQIKSNGWIVGRVPRNPRTLGVRISALESAPAYRGKGMVEIGRDDDGKVDLNLTGNLAEGKRLRVEIRSQGKILAASNEDLPDRDAMGNTSLHTSLKRARDTLFDEELFHELSRESTALWNRGVKWTDQGIIVPFESDADIVLSLATPGDAINPAVQESTPQTRFYQQVVMSLAPILRILLSHGFRRIYNRRTAPPQPITSRKPARDVHHILYPLLIRTQHQSVHHSLNEVLQSISSVLKRAGFDLSLKTPRDDMGLQEIIERSKTSAIPVVEAIVDKLCNPTVSTYILRMLDSEPTLKIMFRPGPEFRYELENVPVDSQMKGIPSNLIMTDQTEFENAILHLIQLRLTEFLFAKMDPTKWILDSPHTGEFRKKAKPQDRSRSRPLQMVRVQVRRGRFDVVWFKPVQGSSEVKKDVWSVIAGDQGEIDIVARLAEIDATS